MGSFCGGDPFTTASAQIITEADHNDYYPELKSFYQQKRDLLFDALSQSPLRPLEPEGSYFIMADSSELGYEDDMALCLDLPKRIGVVAIPPSAFYAPEHKYLAKT
ncbi:MAG: aminotransferase class I/II-fold pyridoxal phosphate-dependent enzyme [Deinococcales bacterium]